MPHFSWAALVPACSDSALDVDELQSCNERSLGLVCSVLATLGSCTGWQAVALNLSEIVPQLAAQPGLQRQLVSSTLCTCALCIM